jgi:hypothetical protein
MATDQEPTEYEVQTIIAHMYWPSGLFCYIKWTGYSDEENTWEPSDNMGHCQHKVDEY